MKTSSILTGHVIGIIIGLLVGMAILPMDNHTLIFPPQPAGVDSEGYWYPDEHLACPVMNITSAIGFYGNSYTLTWEWNNVTSPRQEYVFDENTNTWYWENTSRYWNTSQVLYDIRFKGMPLGFIPSRRMYYSEGDNISTKPLFAENLNTLFGIPIGYNDTKPLAGVPTVAKFDLKDYHFNPTHINQTIYIYCEIWYMDYWHEIGNYPFWSSNNFIIEITYLGSINYGLLYSTLGLILGVILLGVALFLLIQRRKTAFAELDRAIVEGKPSEAELDRMSIELLPWQYIMPEDRFIPWFSRIYHAYCYMLKYPQFVKYARIDLYYAAVQMGCNFFGIPLSLPIPPIIMNELARSQFDATYRPFTTLELKQLFPIQKEDYNLINMADMVTPPINDILSLINPQYIDAFMAANRPLVTDAKINGYMVNTYNEFDVNRHYLAPFYKKPVYFKGQIKKIIKSKYQEGNIIHFLPYQIYLDLEANPAYPLKKSEEKYLRYGFDRKETHVMTFVASEIKNLQIREFFNNLSPTTDLGKEITFRSIIDTTLKEEGDTYIVSRKEIHDLNCSLDKIRELYAQSTKNRDPRKKVKKSTNTDQPSVPIDNRKSYADAYNELEVTEYQQSPYLDEEITADDTDFHMFEDDDEEDKDSNNSYGVKREETPEDREAKKRDNDSLLKNAHQLDSYKIQLLQTLYGISSSETPEKITFSTTLPESITYKGTVRMARDRDRTISVDFQMSQNGKNIGHLTKSFAKYDPEYRQLKRLVNPISAGETKTINWTSGKEEPPMKSFMTVDDMDKDSLQAFMTSEDTRMSKQDPEYMSKFEQTYLDFIKKTPKLNQPVIDFGLQLIRCSKPRSSYLLPRVVCVILYALNHFEDHTYSQHDLAAIVGLSDPALKNQYEIEKMYLLMVHKKLNLIQNQEIDAKVSFAIKKHLRRPVRLLIDNSVIEMFFRPGREERISVEGLGMHAITRNFFRLIHGDSDFQWVFSRLNDKEINPWYYDIRLNFINSFNPIHINEDKTFITNDLANYYIQQGFMENQDKKDAIMVAISIYNNIDFLITWDFGHILLHTTSSSEPKYKEENLEKRKLYDSLFYINLDNIKNNLKGITPLNQEVKNDLILENKVVVLNPKQFFNLFWK